MLHYFHSQSAESAAAPNIANLSQALHLLRNGIRPNVRPDAALVDPLDRAIAVFLDTLGSAYLVPASPLPLAELGPLRKAGIPVIDDAEYEATAAESESRRSLLGRFLADDGWPRADHPPAVPRTG